MSTEAWMEEAAARAEKLFARHGVLLTLGGEPTYVPGKPNGPEWNFSAVGPEKLEYAKKFAAALIAQALPGGTAFFSPGKQYPGEPNPRWSLRILYRAGRLPPEEPARQACGNLAAFRRGFNKEWKWKSNWQRFQDPVDPKNEVWALLLDHDDKKWQSRAWKLPVRELRLLETEGPAGLRLPLHLLPSDVSRRSLTLELKDGKLGIFFPPLRREPFLQLLDFCRRSLPWPGVEVHFQGYLPPSLEPDWEVLGIASDPGVIEVNLPPCTSWSQYREWLEILDRAAAASGLFSWRDDRGEFPVGTGGGNHLLFGSPAGEENAFYNRPGWLASILAYWQKHPSLSYLFTGKYVGSSSQAPRSDESGMSLRELELAFADLADRENPPDAATMAETLRHLLVDSAGNSHRAEISIDKFHEPAHPAGLNGLIEFRAIESLPTAEWASAVALLWVSVAARLLERPQRGSLQDHGKHLHDRFFLPSLLWLDLLEVIRDCQKSGIKLESEIYRKIWDWKFPSLLHLQREEGELRVRLAHESWPLLAETPLEGGSTSRFVDSSLRRLEITANEQLVRRFRITCNGRPLPLRKIQPGMHVAGLRYRHTNLYPSLHPRRPVQLPLEIALHDKTTGELVEVFYLRAGRNAFQRKRSRPVPRTTKTVRPLFPGACTHDLRW